MVNQILGVLALSSSAGTFYLSFRACRQKRYRYSIAWIMLGGLLLRVDTGSDLFLHKWDEEYHALVAKNLLRHPLIPTLYDDPVLGYDYRDTSGSHVWLHKPPVALWLIAASLKVFGVNELAVRLPSVLLSTAAIFFTFYIGRHFFTAPVGLLAAFLHATNGFLLRLASGLASTDHVDTVFIALVELGVFLSVLYVRRRTVGWLVLIGLACGLAIQTKWLAGLSVLPIWFSLVWATESPRAIVVKLLMILAVCLVIVAPWELYIRSHFPAEAAFEREFNVQHFFEGVAEHGRPVFYHVANMPRFFGELIYIPMIWFGTHLVRGKRDSGVLALAVWFFVPYLMFSIAATKMPAYVMISAPAVFLIQAAFWCRLESSEWRRRWRTAGGVLLVLLIVLPVLQCVRAMQPLKRRVRNPTWAVELRGLESTVGPRIGTSKAVVFNVERPIAAMFYSPYPAYGFVPTEAQIQRAVEAGYRVIVRDTGNLPERVRNRSDVIVLGAAG